MPEAGKASKKRLGNGNSNGNGETKVKVTPRTKDERTNTLINSGVTLQQQQLQVQQPANNNYNDIHMLQQKLQNKCLNAAKSLGLGQVALPGDQLEKTNWSNY